MVNRVDDLSHPLQHLLDCVVLVISAIETQGSGRVHEACPQPKEQLGTKKILVVALAPQRLGL